jgi:hypothetical protein
MKQEIEQLIHHLGYEKYTASPGCDCGIFIGRCLKEVRERSAAKWDADQSKLISLWADCDETLEASLQSIFEKTEWEEDIAYWGVTAGPEMGSQKSKRVQVPKQKPIRELFECLLQLNLAE